jgi:hypothetical protein
MDRVHVSILIYNNMAYIPTLAKTKLGVHITIEPVYTSDLNINVLTQAVEKALQSGNPKIPHPTRDEIETWPDPVLKATKVSSWSKLSKGGGTTYHISFGSDSIILYFYKKDEKGRFITDISKTLKFPPETNIRDIVKIILDDINSRSED